MAHTTTKISQLRLAHHFNQKLLRVLSRLEQTRLDSILSAGAQTMWVPTVYTEPLWDEDELKVRSKVPAPYVSKHLVVERTNVTGI